MTALDIATDTLVLDETRPLGSETDGNSAPAGLATVTANFADNFTVDFGSDGPGTATYALTLSGGNVNSGLFALGVNGAPGTQIVLNQVGNDIVGTANGDEYIRISVDAAGVVTFSQSKNVWHAVTNDDDDTSTLTLTLENANLLQLVQTVTDADGDVAAASINLGAGVFQIEDDGPNAIALEVAPDTFVLDETRPLGSETDGDSDPAGLATVTANFADNFASVGVYGTDGPGTTTYALTLAGADVNSGLFALGVNEVPGTQIVLNKVGNDIVGTANGDEYIRISVDASGVVTFSQSKNVWHAVTTDDDDTSTLTLENANLLQLVQTVTDADGDVDTASINLGTGVFQIEDDGPALVASAVGAVDEDDLVAEIVGTSSFQGNSDTVSPGDDVADSAPLGTGGSFGVNFGADGAAAVGAISNLTMTAAGGLGPVALTSQGDAVSVVADGANAWKGVADGRDVFTLSFNVTTGNYTFTLLDNLDHPIGDDPATAVRTRAPRTTWC